LCDSAFAWFSPWDDTSDLSCRHLTTAQGGAGTGKAFLKGWIVGEDFRTRSRNFYECWPTLLSRDCVLRKSPPTAAVRYALPKYNGEKWQGFRGTCHPPGGVWYVPCVKKAPMPKSSPMAPCHAPNALDIRSWSRFRVQNDVTRKFPHRSKRYILPATARPGCRASVYQIISLLAAARWRVRYRIRNLDDNTSGLR